MWPMPRPADAQTPATAAGPASFAPIVDRVRGAVVSVKVKIVESADNSEMPGMPHLQPGDPLERFFRQFGQIPRQQPRTGQALGSGFIISSDGYVVTNNHVVENATDVTVTMDDGKTAPANGRRDRSQDRPRPAQDQGRRQLSLCRVFLADPACRRLGDRGRQSVRPRRHGDGRHRLGARTRHRRRPL